MTASDQALREAQRAEFEKWAQGKFDLTWRPYNMIASWPTGCYESQDTRFAFAAWQARVPEGMVIVPAEPTEAMQMAALYRNRKDGPHGDLGDLNIKIGYEMHAAAEIYRAMIGARDDRS